MAKIMSVAAADNLYEKSQALGKSDILLLFKIELYQIDRHLIIDSFKSMYLWVVPIFLCPASAINTRIISSAS